MQYQALLRVRDHDHFLTRVGFSSLSYLYRDDSEAKREKERRHASIMVLVSRLMMEGVPLRLEAGGVEAGWEGEVGERGWLGVGDEG